MVASINYLDTLKIKYKIGLNLYLFGKKNVGAKISM
jgi:hypothetical protein